MARVTTTAGGAWDQNQWRRVYTPAPSHSDYSGIPNFSIWVSNTDDTSYVRLIPDVHYIKGDLPELHVGVTYKAESLTSEEANQYMSK